MSEDKDEFSVKEIEQVTLEQLTLENPSGCSQRELEMRLLPLDAGPRDGSSSGRNSAETVSTQQTTRSLKTLRDFTCRKGNLHI